MRPVVIIEHLGKQRPAVLMTRQSVAPRLTQVTIAPITSTIRNLSTEVPVGPANGIDHDSVISCDNITTLPAGDILYTVGHLNPEQDSKLSEAVTIAFDLY